MLMLKMSITLQTYIFEQIFKFCENFSIPYKSLGKHTLGYTLVFYVVLYR